MSDFENYAEQGLLLGRTVGYEVTELVNADGTHPVLHVEHLGAVNASVIEELIARAGAEVEEVDAKPSVVRIDAENRSDVARHCVKRIERVFFRDGSSAGDENIPAFVRALPARAFARLMAFVSDEANFCKFPIAEKPDVLAEK